jgi:RHS repeat-associated protein
VSRRLAAALPAAPERRSFPGLRRQRQPHLRRHADPRLRRREPAATRTAYIPDIQGSIIATLDSTSATLTPANYLPFGANASAPNTFAYTGQRIDPESGLYYYRARHYSPLLGRFLQSDPIRYRGGINLYAYVGNDPLNLTDSNGLVADGFMAGASNALLNTPISAALQNGSFAFNAGALAGEIIAPVAVLAIGNGIFGRASVATAEGESAANIANGPRLAQQLSLESANSPFTASGELTQDAINSSRQIIAPGELGNPAIPQGVGKYATSTFQSPSGDFQVHYYMNPTTMKPYYELDYKTIFNAGKPVGAP